jgi:hypothetical protein
MCRFPQRQRAPKGIEKTRSAALSVTGKIALIITSVLVSGRRIQVRHKGLVKVTVKFIRKGIHLQQTESGLPQRREGSGFKVGIYVENLLVLGPFSPWDDFLGLDHCLVK